MFLAALAQILFSKKAAFLIKYATFPIPVVARRK